MKKPIFALALSLGLFGMLNSESAFAQVHNNGDISGTQGNPATLPLFDVAGTVFKFLGDRFHTLEIESKAYEMQQDGVSERSFVAAFTAKGALIYQHELDGTGIDHQAGKNAGIQLFPFTVSMTEDGRVFVSATAFALKNMITAEAADMVYGDAFRVLDNLQVLVFEYDKNYMVEGVESYKLKIVSLDTKIDLLGSSKPGTFLAITGGGDIGLHRTVINKDGQMTTITGTDHDNSSGNYYPASGVSGFNASLRYGLEYNTNINTWNINAKLGAEHIWSDGKADDPALMEQYGQDMDAYNEAMAAYPAELSAYKTRKAEYEQQYMNGTQISNESYNSLTGDIMPNEPQSVDRPSPQSLRRALYYMTPSLNLSKRVSKEGKRPVRLGIGLYGNIPLDDATRGFQSIDLTTSDRELFGAKLFINF